MANTKKLLAALDWRKIKPLVIGWLCGLAVAALAHVVGAQMWLVRLLYLGAPTAGMIGFTWWHEFQSWKLEVRLRPGNTQWKRNLARRKQ